ncbi:hypothetical protein CVU75_02470 [Candidatus Dependentiae bacterium HGW-Dependentiae-1]|nr:MAG: hypothetical protein CVU75_02470 [Candidatus Dependentiae bacterium HGW-Dependentiae-1]
MIPFTRNTLKAFACSALLGTSLFYPVLHASKQKKSQQMSLAILTSVCENKLQEIQKKNTPDDQFQRIQKTRKREPVALSGEEIIQLKETISSLKIAITELAFINIKAQKELAINQAEIAELIRQDKVREWQKIRERKKRKLEERRYAEQTRRRSGRRA